MTPFVYKLTEKKTENCVGIFKQSMGASVVVTSHQADGIDSMETILVLLKSLTIRTLLLVIIILHW
jgi:hypothetical protein